MTTADPKATAQRAPNPNAQPSEAGEPTMQAGEAAATAGNSTVPQKAS